jgi:hypothetical protein
MSAFLRHHHTVWPGQALIARLDEMEPGDADFDAVVFTIGAYIEPHIDEEQELLFPAIRRSGMDVAVLGRRILERRKLLREDVTMIGLPQPQARLSKWARACLYRPAKT